ncbi:MAG: hypothetical protein JST25_08780 [Actinobacteria bacterium]|nr:hypothetical protein [Actinomycetota bacterium]
MSVVAAGAVVLGAAFVSPAFADETPPPIDIGDLPALPSEPVLPSDPQVPAGDSYPLAPWPYPEVGTSPLEAPNAPGPWPLQVPPDALAQLDARRAQLIETYGSVEAGAAVEGIDVASLEAPVSAVVDTRAIELRRLAQELHLMVPSSWTWAAGATTFWIL